MLVVGLVVVACSSSETASRVSPEDGGAETSTGGTSSGGAAGVSGQGGQVSCTVGQETACYGDGLCLGSHVCNADGTAYGPCTCADASVLGGAGGTGGHAPDAAPDAPGVLLDASEAGPDASSTPDAAACPEPCSGSVNFPWLVKSGQPNAQGYAKATATCPVGSVFDTNLTGPESLYCWGCSLATPTKNLNGTYSCGSAKNAPLGSCEIHFRCKANNWCVPLATPCS